MMEERIEDKFDILIEGGIILTLNEKDQIIEDGAIGIKDSMISFVGSLADLEEKGDHTLYAKEYIKANNHLIMPGLINSHTHAAMSLFRGLFDDLPLMEWLEDYIFPVEKRNVDREFVCYGTILACAEMIRSGTTTFCDMYMFEDEVAHAVKEVGMRAIIGEALFDFPSPNIKDWEEGLKFTEELILKWKGDSLILPSVGPHSTYTCSSQLLRESKILSDKYSVPLILHLSETEIEVNIIKARYGKDPVHYLEDLEVLGEKTVGCHCVHLSKDEIKILADYRVKVVHNPESNMKLASGVAPVPDLQSQGVEVSLGTDGCASNNNLDMFQEMDSCAKLHKVMRLDPGLMRARDVVDMATLGGARVFGLDGEIGSIQPGKRADIIAIDLDQPHLTPLYNPFSHLVYCVKGSDVSLSIINGKVVMKDNILTTIDEEKVLSMARNISQRVRNNLK